MIATFVQFTAFTEHVFMTAALFIVDANNDT